MSRGLWRKVIVKWLAESTTQIVLTSSEAGEATVKDIYQKSEALEVGDGMTRMSMKLMPASHCPWPSQRDHNLAPNTRPDPDTGAPWTICGELTAPI
jgi:hypothetical protein